MRLVFAAALSILAACAPEAGAPAPPQNAPPALDSVTLPQSDGAGNRMEALSQLGDGGVYCVGAEEWCLEASEGQPPRITQGAITTTLHVRGEGTVAVWPIIIRRAPIEGGRGGVLVGITQTVQQAYSGGGGSATFLAVYQVVQTDPGLRATEVARLPLAAAIDIRACFDEEGTRQRADACSDQYNFVSRIRLDETVTSGAPRLILETAAGTFPGHVTRSEDSLERPPLTQADLVWAQDSVCSFRRTFSQSSAGPYVPDTELPACSDYLEP